MITKPHNQRLKVNTKSATVLSIDDTGNFRTAIIRAIGKAQKVQVVSPYGLCSNPSDESLAIAFNLQNVAANTIAIIDDPKNRKKNLAKGEVALYNYESQSFVYLKEDNSIEIESASGANIKLTASGDIELNGSSDFVTAFTDMKTAFDQMRTELNALITQYNLHTHAASGDASFTLKTVAQGTPATADMSGAKVDTVKVP